MATVEQLIDRIEKRIGIASGFNVQVHGEGQMVEMLRHKYNTLFDSRWWMDYLTLETFTLDGSTGTVAADLSTKIKRFIDIQGVFLGGSSSALPILSPGTNPLFFNSEAIAPFNNPAKVFRVYPMTRTDDVHVWYRTRLTDDDWSLEKAMITNVNMDDELLILGTVYDYLVDDGAAEIIVSKYERQYAEREQQLVNLSFQHGVSKQRQSTGIPTQWSIDG